MPVVCISIVCGASVRTNPEPLAAAIWCSAWPMKVGLTPFSRSMSTPSNPNRDMIERTLWAKLFALVASDTEIVPF